MTSTQAIDDLKLQGYCVIPELVPEVVLESVLAQVVACGITRIDGMLNIIPDLSKLAEDPFINEILHSVMGEEICLANALSIKSSGPGFPGGMLHIDPEIDQLSKCKDLPFWHTVQVLWALNDTTLDNGATRLVPFTHLTQQDPQVCGYAFRKDEDDNPNFYEVPIPLKRGSVIIMHATLWHRGGPNTTRDQPRYLISGYYCIPRLYDEIISCLGFWPGVKPAVHEMMPEGLQDMLKLGLEEGRGGRA